MQESQTSFSGNPFTSVGHKTCRCVNIRTRQYSLKFVHIVQTTYNNNNNNIPIIIIIIIIIIKSKTAHWLENVSTERSPSSCTMEYEQIPRSISAILSVMNLHEILYSWDIMLRGLYSLKVIKKSKWVYCLGSYVICCTSGWVMLRSDIV
jgi:hypothetical protein